MQTQLRKINYKIPNLLHIFVWHLSGITASLYPKLQKRKAPFKSCLILNSHLLNELFFQAWSKMSVKTARTDNGLKDLDFFSLFRKHISFIQLKRPHTSFYQLKSTLPLFLSFFSYAFQQQEKSFRPQITAYEKLQQGGDNSTKTAVAYIKWSYIFRYWSNFYVI